MKYIWRKRTGARWLHIYHDELIRRFGDTMAVIERPGSKRVLLEIFCRTGEQARELVREFGGSVEKLRPGWLQHFAKQAQAKPLRIGSRLVILRSPEKKAGPPKAIRTRSIVIPAETAFGTGEHATTAMCLRLLERTTRCFRPGWRMLDAGTGSGILALAAIHFGAGRVLAVENDPLACAIAIRNARTNRIRNIEFSTGDILKQRFTGKFDVITANLFSEILIKAAPSWSQRLVPDGQLIISGVLRNQELAVIRALRSNRFTVLDIRRRGKWIAVRAEHKSKKAVDAGNG